MMKTSKTVRFTHLTHGLRVPAIAFALAAACMMFGTATLRAGCGPSGNNPLGSLFKPSAFMTAGMPDPGPGSGPPSVVGLWHALLLVNGDAATPLFQSLVQYHADGLEAESADQSAINPANYCMGVWQQHGNTVEIYHVAWLYQDGNTAGYAVITQKNKLSDDGNSYEGTFKFTQYDNHGVMVGQPFGGTTSAKRIDFDHPFTDFTL